MSKRKHQEDPNGDESTKTCKSECPHINQAVDLQEVKTVVAKNESVLSFFEHCKKRSTFKLEKHLIIVAGNSVLLLCGNQTCSPLLNKSVLDHSPNIPRNVSHAYFVDMSNWNVWCNLCDNFVNVACNKKLLEVVKYLQEQAKPIAIANTAENILPSVSSSEKNDDNKTMEKTLLSELECPVCFKYIIPPIYQCVTGHNICGECKVKLPECPTCKSKFRNTRNFALEQMTAFLTYPCKFVDLGCDFACKSGQIRNHQKLCVYKPHTCPLKDYVGCSWIDCTKNIYQHILDEHHDKIPEKDLVSLIINANYLARENAACYVIKFEDRLFKLHHSYKRDEFYWTIQLIGPSEDAKKYQFEIDIIDNTDRGLRMFWRNFCAPLTEKYQSFQNVETYVSSHLNQIRPFMSESDILTYRVRIDSSPDSSI